jgi:hypothetical protein
MDADLIKTAKAHIRRTFENIPDYIEKVQNMSPAETWAEISAWQKNHGPLSDDDPTILDNGVWIWLVNPDYNISPRKIKAVSERDVYYDGTYKGLYGSYREGSNYFPMISLDGEQVLDFPDYRTNPAYKDMILDFLKSCGQPKLDTFDDDDLLDI